MILLESGLYAPTDVPHPTMGDVLNCCLRYTAHAQRRTALDIGAYIGEWTVPLAQNFEYVIAFEPISQAYECLLKNTLVYVNVTRRNEAVGQLKGKAVMRNKDPKKPFSWETGPSYKGDSMVVDIESIDGMKLYEEPIDFIKVNTNGSELRVLRGAEQTITRCKPLVYVNEDNDPHRTACAYLVHLGMKVLWTRDRNYLFGWRHD